MFNQSSYDCRFDWGMTGTKNAAERGDITIIVDVLSFSSTAVTAVNYGAYIFPYASYGYGEFFAKQVGAEMCLNREDARKCGGHSLSPLTFSGKDKGKSYVLYSLNGATCSRFAHKVAFLLIGCLLNASAVAREANSIHHRTGKAVTVIACGEQWQGPIEETNSLRPCIEDYLGAGAILAHLDGSKSPEVKVAVSAFNGVKTKTDELIWDSISGRELREQGFDEDVRFCSALDIYDSVPRLVEEHFENAISPMRQEAIKKELSEQH